MVPLSTSGFWASFCQARAFTLCSRNKSHSINCVLSFSPGSEPQLSFPSGAPALYTQLYLDPTLYLGSWQLTVISKVSLLTCPPLIIPSCRPPLSQPLPLQVTGSWRDEAGSLLGVVLEDLNSPSHINSCHGSWGSDLTFQWEIFRCRLLILQGEKQ